MLLQLLLLVLANLTLLLTPPCGDALVVASISVAVADYLACRALLA